MGIRKAKHIIGSGFGADCMMCHGGSIMGTSYVGLGNSSLDIGPGEWLANNHVNS